MRKNLDPFHQFDDVELNDALRAAGLFSLKNVPEEGNLTLDSEILPGGGNLSVGEKQILALARALVRDSKIFILDEGQQMGSLSRGPRLTLFWIQRLLR